MRDGHHSGSYGFTIFAQFNVGPGKGNHLSAAVVEPPGSVLGLHQGPVREALLGAAALSDLPRRGQQRQHHSAQTHASRGGGRPASSCKSGSDPGDRDIRITTPDRTSPELT